LVILALVLLMAAIAPKARADSAPGKTGDSGAVEKVPYIR